MKTSTKDKFRHGNVTFVMREVQHDYGQKYVIVPSTANPSDVLIFMRDVWKLECPMFVLSVLTGRSTDKEWQSRKTTNAFKSAIKNAAINTDMWLLTHGLNFGITRIIGDAYNEEMSSRAVGRSLSSTGRGIKGDPSLPLVLIGICSSALLADIEVFNGNEDQVLYTIRGGKRQEGKIELDPHHTHYIIVDENEASGSLYLRAKIERKLNRSETFRTGRFVQSVVPESAKMIPSKVLYMADSAQTISGHSHQPIQTEDRTNITITTARPDLASPIQVQPPQLTMDEDRDTLRDVVPVVCMIIGGGVITLKDIAERVYLGIPILVCRGSGAASDILAYVYEELSSNDEHEIRPDVSRRLDDAFPNTDQETIDECVSAVMQIVNGCVIRRSTEDGQLLTRTVMSIFDTRNWKTDPTKLHKELLLTLLKCQRERRTKTTMNREQVYRQMQLLLDWNAPELTQFEIFEQEDVPVYAIPVHIFEQAFVRPKREAFVELFLDRNFQIQRFFTRDRVRRWLLLNESNFFSEVCVYQLLKSHDCLQNYDTDDDISPLINLIIERLTGLNNIMRPIELRKSLNQLQILRIVTSETQAFTALTMLAALLNRHNLARVLLKRSDCPIPLALFCSMLYTKLVHHCREPFMKQQLKDQAAEMADYAVGILDMCFQSTDHCSPSETLDQPHSDFSDLTTIQIAYKSKVLQFLAHPLCQRWISDKYYGGLRFLDLSIGLIRMPLFIKVISSSLFVFPSIWWISLDSNDESVQDCLNDSSDSNLAKNSNSWRNRLRHRQVVMTKLWHAPVTKFYFSFISYILFLLTLGIATLWPSCGNLLLDTILGIWICTMTIELARCTYINYTASDGHVSLTNNIIDICCHTIFLILFMWVRMISQWRGHANVSNGKLIMCIGILYFTYRVPFVYMAISETLGPQLVWIEYTIKHDFADFVKLLLLAIFAGGVTINAMIYPFQILDDTWFSRIVVRSFLALFLTEKGDLEPDPYRTCVPPGPSSKICVDQASGAQSIVDIGMFSPDINVYSTMNLTPSCPTPSFKAWIFTLQHFVLMKLFLMTILYAMFNNSSLSIAKYSSLVWMFKRYENVMAFKTTSTLPPPFSLLYYIICYLTYCYSFTVSRLKRCLSKKRRDSSSKDSIDGLYDDSINLRTFERIKNTLNGRLSIQKKSRKWLMDIASLKTLHVHPTIKSTSKDGNYWRLLAQEYIGKREEGLLTIAGSKGEGVTSIRNKLLGESSSTLSQNRQNENLKLALNQMKDHISITEKAIDKLSERMHVLQEDVVKLADAGASSRYMQDDIKQLENTMRTLLSQSFKKQKVTDELYMDDPLNISNMFVAWNDIHVINEIMIDRRSWQINPLTNLPVQYKIKPETKLPACPWVRGGQKKDHLPLFGPNHQVKLICRRKADSTTILQINEEDNWDLPSRFVQNPSIDTSVVAWSLFTSVIVESPLNQSPIRIWRGFASNDGRNSESAWVEVEYWLSDLDEDNVIKEVDVKWVNLNENLPDEIKSLL